MIPDAIRAAYGLAIPRGAEVFSKGTRVRVSDPDFGGVGTVVVMPVPYVSRVGVAFDDAPGFVWQFERDLVEAL